MVLASPAGAADAAPEEPEAHLSLALRDLGMQLDDLDPAARQKLETILLHWFVDQPERAGCAPLAARDVYELDVAHWLELLARAGTRVDNYRCTDVWGLFYQYVFSPA